MNNFSTKNSTSSVHRFAHILMKISETYDIEFTDAKVAIWTKLIRDQFDIDSIEKAVHRYMSDPDSGQYKPVPASIIKFITGSRKNKTFDALTAVQYAVTVASSRQSVCFSDAVINAAIAQTGGWPGAYSRLSDDAMRDDYLDAFRVAYDRISVAPGTHPAYLLGRAAESSFEPIGDVSAVMHVATTGYDPKKPMAALSLENATKKIGVRNDN